MTRHREERPVLPKASFFKLHGTKVLIGLAVLSLAAAAFIGSRTAKTDFDPLLKDVMPKATAFTLLKSQPANNEYLYTASDASGQIGYVTSGQGQGYGGPLVVLVGWSKDGKIQNIQIASIKDTPSWFSRLYTSKYFDQYIGRSFADPFKLKTDINAISGATRSSDGVSQGVRASRALLAEQLGKPVVEEKPQLSFGIPEIMLLLGIGLVVLFRMAPPLRRLAWPRPVMLAFGLVVFGLILTIPLSLVNFEVFLIGFQPDWQTHMVLYMLTFGLVGLALAFAKNFWCFWICPFAALQEGMHFVGNPKPRPITRRQLFFRNTRFVVLWGVTMVVLVARSPAISVFEPWNTIFSLKGDLSQWLLVAGALGVGIFIYNFWCHYLCPVGAVMDIALKARMVAVNGVKRLAGR